jgi:hypothetical protein
MINKSKNGIICDVTGEEVSIKSGKMTYYSVSVDTDGENIQKDHVLDLDISDKTFEKWQNETKKPRCAFCGSECINDNEQIMFYIVKIKKVNVSQSGNLINDAFLKKMCSKCYQKLKSDVLRVINKNQTL